MPAMPAISHELIVTVAAGVMAALIFTWLIKVVKTTLATAVKIAVFALCLQIFLGVGPQALWQQVLKFLQSRGLGW
jgi:hypothetical protein